MTDASIPGRGMQRRGFVRNLAGLALALPVLSACTGAASVEDTRARQRRIIEANFDATLTRCFLIAPATRELVADAVGVLVFPTVALINPVTAEWAGAGALREGPVFANYFFLSVTKDGMTQEPKSQSIIFLFRTLDALNQFRLSNPWRASEAIAASQARARKRGPDMRGQHPDLLALVLQGQVLMTNPAMPEMVVVPLDM